ncbi:MAG: hypothetical protein ACREBF_00720 [Candidatus Micrarchaeales archaeon]
MAKLQIPKPTARKLAIVAVPIVVIALIVLGIVFYTQSVLAAATSGAPIQAAGALQLSASVLQSGTATYNNAQQIVPYVVANVSFKNATGFQLLFNVYAKNPLPNIYYLNTTDYCYQCYSDGALFANLSAYLKRYGVLYFSTLTYINPSRLASLPKDSIIVVPSGLIPVYLVPGSAFQLNGTADLLTLMNNNDTIIYLGENFSRSSGPSGVIFSTSASALKSLSNAGLGTGPFSETNIVNYGFYFNKPTFGFTEGPYAGFAQAADSGNGTVVTFSNTQALGWKNNSAVAQDIARVISSHFWIGILASGSYSNSYSYGSGTLGVPAFSSLINDTQNVGKIINSSYPLVTAILTNSSSFLEKQIPVKIPYISNGSIGIQPYVGQTQKVQISVSLNTNSQQPQLVVPHIDLYTKNMSYVSTISLQFFNTTSNTNVFYYHSFTLPSGTYIAVLRNFFDHNYSRAIINVTGVTLTPQSLNFKNGTFSFTASSNNVAVSNASYSIDLNGAYGVSGEANGGVITYSLPKDTVIGYGTENFNLYMFGSKYTYTTSNVQQVLNIPTIYIELGIVIVAILILNLIVKPQNRDEYYVDVPEFQQAKKVNVKVNKSEVLNVFDKVNFLYHWKYMPLTLDEIKSGIGNNIRYNNIPVSITVQNVALIMSKLEMYGDVVSSGGYYAPKRWMNESGFDVEYLSVFRRMRDYSVGHAILFTDVGASEAADITLSKSGAQTHIVIYSSISGMRNIEVMPNFKTYVVFADEEKMLEFSEKLYKSYGNQAEMLKIGISYGYIRLVDASNLDQIVF